MDFSYSEEQQAVADLAAQILSDHAGHDALRALETSGDARFDSALWQAFAEAGLLGIAVPESQGGGGLGFLELALIAEQVGRRTAPIPFVETTVLGALPIAAFGSDAQKRALLPGVVSGETILTAALQESGAPVERPETTASADDDGFTLSGRKICVPAGQLAERVVVPARTGDDEIAIFLVDPAAEGFTATPLETTSGQPEACIELDGVRVGAGDRLGEPGRGGEILAWLELRATAALCAVSVGVCDEALQLTAEYTKTRKQFDQPIATFQAVGQRAADAYIDTEAIRLTSLQAAWRIDAELEAATHVAAAKYWAAEGGQRVVHTAQHLHGGVGVDRDYPLHRYFLYAKQLELSLGGTTAQLRKLGAILARGA